MSQASPLAISILLPTFNRAAFLPDAFASIEAQNHQNWELIVVDDGSTDETPRVLDELVGRCTRPVKVVRQANGGAYAARNTALDHASNDAVAFFDSDDLWLPHHLERCAAALTRHPELDWVFAACRMVDMESQREIGPTTFRVDGQPRPFLSLHTIADGDLRLIDDVDVTRMQIAHGLYCGLQNSVIRRTVFRERRFWPEYLVVEDVLFLIRFLAEGGRIAYFDDVHVIYRVHADNSSASASGHTPSRQVRIFSEKVLGLERVAREAPLRQSDRRKLRQRLAHERFWGLGYAGYWQGGHPQEARTCYRAALREWPWSPAMWKTYLGSLIRSAPRPADGD